MFENVSITKEEDNLQAVSHISKFAVENHLIVLRPKDGTIGKCKKLVKFLKGESTNQWFNQRIRCRHLTVSAVKDMPLME